MIEYCIGEPIPISDSERIFKYRVREHIYQGDILPDTEFWINPRQSSKFIDCTIFNLKLDYKAKNKKSRGFLDDFQNDSSLKADCTVDTILENQNSSEINNRFCVREIKALATLEARNNTFYWSILIKNYDVFDKLEEKVANIMPIIQYGELYEDTVGISLKTEKMKVKIILDYYFNLLDKNKKKALSEKVRFALLYL